MVDEALIRRLEGLAVNCDNTDGWNYAAEDIREAVRILSALATQEAEPGLIDEIHELAGMVGATFTPHEQPTPEAEPVVWRKGDIAVAVMSTQDGLTKDKEYVVLDAEEDDTISILDNYGRTHFRMTHYFTHPSPSITEAEVEAAVDRAAIAWCGKKERETSLDDIAYFKNNWRALPGLRTYVAEALLDRALTAALKARRQG